VAPQRLSLVDAGRPQLEHHAARLERQPVGAGQLVERRAEELERILRVPGPAGVDRHRMALVLHEDLVLESQAAQHVGQHRPHLGHTGMGAGSLQLAADRVPALQPVVAEHHHLAQLRRPVQAGVVRGHGRRPAGDDRQRPQVAAEAGQCGQHALLGPALGGVLDDRRQHAVEVERQQRPGRVGQQRFLSGAAGLGRWVRRRHGGGV
jgi:hypothetical protein